jgi:hypothetical protein
MKRFVGLLFVGIIFLSSVQTGWSQARAQISGTVRDQSGAVLPGVEVTVTQTETGISRSTLTNETGGFELPNLTLGPHRLEAALSGFRTYVETGIVLQVNSNPVVNAVLQVGQVAETVEVQANAALVETRATGIGQVVENQRILELPLNGRNATDLIQLAGAAVPVERAPSSGMPGGQSISVAGGLQFGIGYFLDGALHTDMYDAMNLPFPFPNALQEFKVETSALSAQSGGRSAGAINAVTKSGTNDIHGDVFEFVRNGVFNARNAFAPVRDSLKRNQFGGTIGGPIKENKLFFFGGYQGTLTRSDPVQNPATVPTAAMLEGDFTTITSAACNGGRAITLPLPFVGNRIPPSQLDPAAVKIANALPKATDPCGRIQFGITSSINEHQFVGRLDYQWSSKQSFFARYMATTYFTPAPYSFSQNPLATIVGGKDNLSQAVSLGNTYLFSGNTVNSFRLGYNRTSIHRFNSDFFGPQDLGINAYSYLPHFIVMTITGGPTIGSGTEVEATNRADTYSINEDLSLIRGAHQFSLGGSVSNWRSNFNGNVRSAGGYSFTGIATGLGMADFFTGKLTSLNQSGPNTVYTRNWQIGLYGQDTWKLSRQLTLNLGLRWEPFLPPRFANGAIYNFDYDRLVKGVRSTVYRNAPAGLYFPGDSGFPGKAGMNDVLGNFSPRIGLAWDPKGDGRSSIRASYGIAYDFVNGRFWNNTTNAPPWGFNVIVNSPVGGFRDPFLNVAGGNPFPIAEFGPDAKFTQYGPFLGLPPNQKMTRVHQWNLSLQRQFGSSWLLAASYVGSETEHLWQSVQLNPGVFLGLGACNLQGVAYSTCSTNTNLNQRRVFSLAGLPGSDLLGFVDQYTDGGTASYNGLILSVQRRARAITVNGNYTWSHCVGDFTQGGGTPGTGTGLLDPNNRRFDRGNCSTDRRHLANVTWVTETPQFANEALRTIATGWKLSGTYRVSSGQPLTLTTSLDRQLSGATGQRPFQQLQDPYCTEKTVNCWLNTAAFRQPDLGSLGNIGRFTVFGPGFWGIDAALSRAFRIKENRTLEIRAEAFNLTNSVRLNAPTTNTNTNTFGQILSAQDPRIMQFAMKFVY